MLKRNFKYKRCSLDLTLVLSNNLQDTSLFYFHISDCDPSYPKQKMGIQIISES